MIFRKIIFFTTPLFLLATSSQASFSSTRTYQQSTADIKGEIEISTSIKDRTTKLTSEGSNLESTNYQAETQGDYTLEGSNLTATENASIDADSVTITAAKESETTSHSESSETVGSEGYKAENDEVSVNISETKRTKTENTDTTSYKASEINAGNLTIKSKKDIDVLGSDVNVQNDAVVESKEGNITIADLEGSTTTTTTETEEKKTIGIGVRNAYVDAARAIENISKAKNALNEANNKLKDAKTKIAEGKMNPDDLIYFKKNLAAATINLANSTIAAAKAGASAASNAGTYGFTGSLNTSIENKESTSTNNKTKSHQSNFKVGGNTKLKANSNKNNKGKITIKGSNLDTQGDTEITAKELELIAAKETENETSSKKETNISTSTSISGGGDVGDTSINADNTDTNSKLSIRQKGGRGKSKSFNYGEFATIRLKSYQDQWLISVRCMRYFCRNLKRNDTLLFFQFYSCKKLVWNKLCRNPVLLPTCCLRCH